MGPNDPNRESALSQLAKTTISLTLTSKFELLDGDDKDLKTLMTKSVQWIVGRIFAPSHIPVNKSSV